MNLYNSMMPEGAGEAYAGLQDFLARNNLTFGQVDQAM